MAGEGAGSCSSRTSSDGSNESDLDDIPLFHPSLMPGSERHAPFRLAMPHAGPMPSSAPNALGANQQNQNAVNAEDQLKTPRAPRGPPKLALNLGHLVPADAAGAQLGFALPSATNLQHLSRLNEHGSNHVTTPEPAIEPLPTSRTSRTPVTALQLPSRSREPEAWLGTPAAVVTTAGMESLPASNPGHVAGGMPGVPRPSLPKLALSTGPLATNEVQHDRLTPSQRLSKYSSTGSIHSTHSSPCLSPSHAEYTSPEDESLLAGSDDISVDQTSPSSSDAVVEACLLSQPFCRVVVKGHKHNNQSAKDGQCKAAVSDTVCQRVLQHCGKALGVGLQHLDLYQVMPMPGAQQGPQRLAVNISTNSFSLAALEQLLSRNKQLEALQQQNVEVIASMRKDHHDLSQRHMDLQHTHTQLLVSSTQQECAFRAAECRQQQLEHEVKLLRDKLREADDHRHQLRDVIEKLSKEMHFTLRSHVQQQQPLQQ